MDEEKKTHQIDKKITGKINAIYQMIMFLPEEHDLFKKHDIKPINGREAFLIKCPSHLNTGIIFDGYTLKESHLSIDKYYATHKTSRQYERLSPFHYTETYVKDDSSMTIHIYFTLSGQYICSSITKTSLQDGTKVDINIDEQKQLVFQCFYKNLEEIFEDLFSLRGKLIEEHREKSEILKDKLSNMWKKEDLSNIIRLSEEIMEKLEWIDIYSDSGYKDPQINFFSTMIASLKRNLQLKSNAKKDRECSLNQDDQGGESTHNATLDFPAYVTKEEYNDAIIVCLNEMENDLKNIDKIDEAKKFLKMEEIRDLLGGLALTVGLKKYNARLETIILAQNKIIENFKKAIERRDENKITSVFNETKYRIDDNVFFSAIRNATVKFKNNKSNKFNLWLCDYFYQNSVRYRNITKHLTSDPALIKALTFQSTNDKDKKTMISLLAKCREERNFDAFAMFLDHGVDPNGGGNLGADGKFEYSVLSQIINTPDPHNETIAYIKELKKYSVNPNVSTLELRDVKKFKGNTIKHKRNIIREQKVGDLVVVKEHRITPLDFELSKEKPNREIITRLLPDMSLYNMLFAFSKMQFDKKIPIDVFIVRSFSESIIVSKTCRVNLNPCDEAPYRCVVVFLPGEEQYNIMSEMYNSIKQKISEKSYDEIIEQLNIFKRMGEVKFSHKQNIYEDYVMAENFLYVIALKTEEKMLNSIILAKMIQSNEAVSATSPTCNKFFEEFTRLKECVEQEKLVSVGRKDPFLKVFPPLFQPQSTGNSENKESKNASKKNAPRLK